MQYFTDINFLDAYRFGLEHAQASLFEKQIVGFLGHHLTFSGYMMMLAIPVVYVAILKDDCFNKNMRLELRAGTYLGQIDMLIATMDLTHSTLGIMFGYAF